MNHTNYIRFIACILLLSGFSYSRVYAQSITASEYFPLDAGNSWTYIVDNVVYNTITVQNGITPVNGIATKGLLDSAGGISYFTSDGNGIREHSEFDPIPPASTGSFSPPLVFVKPVSNVPETVNGSGTATLSIPSVRPAPFVLSYTVTSTVQAFERITVPAGTFDTVRVWTRVRIFGDVFGTFVDETSTQTNWVARHIGLIKEVFTDSDGTETSLLTSTTVVPPLVLDDIVIDFGGIGLWARMNDASWLKLNNNSPDRVVVADVDGNGQDDVVADFGSSFGGIFVKRNSGGWRKLHNFAAQLMAVGDLDGNGKDDVVIDFGGIGLWARMNDTSWLKLNNSSPDLMVIGDIDGNGQDDVIADFSSSFGGVFVKRNLGGWSQLHNSGAQALAVGDLDNSGKDDVIVDFGGIGLWARMNDTNWLKLHNNSPGLIATGDVDGNGASDVLATFAGQGLWQKLNLGGWSKLNNNEPDEVVTGDVDGNGQHDIIAGFGSSIGGVFIKRNGAAWTRLHNTAPESLAVGGLDGN